MSANAATLNITIDLKTAEGQNALKALQGQAHTFKTKAEQSFKGAEKSAKGFGSGLSAIKLGLAGLAVATVAFAKSSMDAYGVQKRAVKDLEATLKSTKNAAGLTSQELQNMASELQAVTNFGDEATIKGQAMLLTFTKIGKDVFPQATEAMLNMAQKFGGGPDGLATASVQLGKALNDPIMGVGALRRVGVTLTAQQEEQIKKFVEVGDVASAQKVILGELETEFGGLARAMASPMKQLSNLFGDMKEKFGEIVMKVLTPLIPVLNTVVKVFMSLADSLLPIVTQIGGMLVPVFKLLEGAAGRLLPPLVKIVEKVFKAMAPIIAKLVPAIEKLIAGFMPLIEVFTEIISENLDMFIPLLESLVELLVSLTPLIVIASQATAGLLKIGSDMINTVVRPLTNAIKYIIEKGAEAARWVASIFGGDGKQKAQPKAAKPKQETGGGGGGPKVGDVSPDGLSKKPGGGGDSKDAAKAREEADKLLLAQRERLEEQARMWQEYDKERAEARKKADEEMKKLEGESFAREALKRAAESARIEEKERKEMESLDRIQMMKAENIDSDIERERELLRVKLDMLANEFMSEQEYALKRKALENETQKNIQNIQKSQLDSGFAYAQETLGLMSELAAENFEDQKAVSMAQAAVNGAVGITKVLDQFGVFGIPLAALIAAATAKQLAVIQKTKPQKAREGGGMMDPSEKYHINESGRTEFLMNAGATQRNRGALEAMNAGATIGSLTGATPISPPNAIGRGSNVNLSGEFRFQDGALKMQLEKDLKLEQGSMVA